MALSESERRLLDQMEKALAAEDPKLVNTFRGVPQQRRVHPRRATAAGLGFVAGVGLLIGGMMTWPGLSVLGFVVMVACAVIALQSWRPATPDDQDGSEKPRPGRPETPRNTSRTTPSPERESDLGNGFMDRMEERWRRRRDEDF
ncbi:MAG TPA: DUF3040 domain-containing protein [Candidatus Avipropionibacterium avicola]|uniref:DUF3040 domain-containing protein n=1 Tax=Candidatus Avipropionibacterium avicola TaxID=2840701 RepID=A0A9D1KMG3_9ACTN|nr:DUF3040 domain-containing protein [Candidatus Avipropionibacterium avicola]